MRVDARETLKDMHTQVLIFTVRMCLLSRSLVLSHIYMCKHIHCSASSSSPSVDDLLSFFFYSLSSLSRAGMFFDLYSQLDVSVGRFDDVVYRNDDDMTKWEKEEREAHHIGSSSNSYSSRENKKKRRRRRRRRNVQCARARLNGCTHMYRKKEETFILNFFFFVLSMNNE